MRLLAIFCLALSSTFLPSSNAIRMHRIRRQQQQDSSALTTQTEAGFSSTVGTLSAYNGHVYTTTVNSGNKHITPSLNKVDVKGPTFAQISYDGESSVPSICGVTSTGIIYCSKGKLTDAPEWVLMPKYQSNTEKAPGIFQQVVIRDGKLIALRTDGSIAYTKYDAVVGVSSVAWLPMVGAFSQISFDGDTICGLLNSKMMELQCHDNGLVTQPRWRNMQPPSGAVVGLSYVQIEGNELIGRKSDQTVFTGKYTPGAAAITWKQINGKFLQLAIDPRGNKVWAIDATGALFWRVPISLAANAVWTPAN